MPTSDGTAGLDLERVRRHLEATLPGLLVGPLQARVVAGGRSNLTYRVSDGHRTVAIRRPPLGHVLATAHDMAREFRVIRALGPTPVPVPEVYHLCEDIEVTGAPFYVMEWVEGTPYRRAEQIAPLGEERVRAISTRMVDTLASLHDVDPGRVGLGDFGRPEGFLERQVRRWKKQLDASRSRDLPGIEELHARLERMIPAGGGVAIVHGDFRLDNLLVDAHDRVRAVLDWEMATLGDPLTDLALLVVYQRLAHLDTDTPVSDVSTAPGFLTDAEVVDRYVRTSGRDVGDLGFYLGLGYFKLAVILEGIHYRFVHGQTVGEGFDRIGAAVTPLIAAGLGALREEH